MSRPTEATKPLRVEYPPRDPHKHHVCYEGQWMTMHEFLTQTELGKSLLAGSDEKHKDAAQ